MADRSSQSEVTRLLIDAGEGDQQAENRLLPLVYNQLRSLARRKMSLERSDHTLQATALVHEAYMRLVGERKIAWAGRVHFYAAAAEAMQRILVDHARHHQREKRGGGRARVPVNVLDLASDPKPDEILAVDEAICRLEIRDKSLGRLVRLRFYGGLSVKETAEAMGLSERTVRRHWEFARTWLYGQLADHGT